MNELVGRTLLNRYRIGALIGSGGMADVYKAYDLKLKREVAVKALVAHLARETSAVQRFRREAETAAGLKHPNIVTIYDVGKSGNLHFIVMDLLPGQTLNQLIKKTGSLPLQQVTSIVSQVASALDYAHSQGVVHRDIKPSNIILDSTGHVTLTDFGIVKAADGTRFTTTGATLGTPEYMSPEQVENKAISPASDIYSLGIVVYEMLAGKTPFTGTTPHVLHAHVYEEPPDIGRLTPRLPAAVVGIVKRALAKNPRQRYRTAGEMATALAGAIRGVPEPPTVRERVLSERPTVVAPPVRRGLPVWALTGGGAGIILLILIIAFSALEKGPATPGGAAVVPTATFTASPTDTPIPPPKATATFTPTATSTSTPTATPTSTSTPMIPSSLPTATATPRSPTATPTLTTETTPPGFKYPAPQLLSPEPWRHFRDPTWKEEIVLVWASVGALASDEYYEVLARALTRAICPWGRERGLFRVTLTKETSVAVWAPGISNTRAGGLWSESGCSIRYGEGGWEWSVRVVQAEGGAVKEVLSPHQSRSFLWKP